MKTTVKSILFGFLALTLTLGFTACGGDGNDPTPSGPDYSQLTFLNGDWEFVSIDDETNGCTAVENGDLTFEDVNVESGTALFVNSCSGVSLPVNVDAESIVVTGDLVTFDLYVGDVRDPSNKVFKIEANKKRAATEGIVTFRLKFALDGGYTNIVENSRTVKITNV